MNKFTRNMITAATALASIATLSTPAMAAGGKGMTWRVYDFAANGTPQQKDAWNALIGAVPGAVIVGCNSKCDAYKGDTVKTETRRIMCFVPGSSAEPGLYPPLLATTPFTNTASPDWRFYFGWSGGQVGLTEPVVGIDIKSRIIGDAMCVKSLREATARMVEHHDNKVGGWGLGATIHPRSKAISELRGGGNCRGEGANYWAAIKNQPANVWDQ